MIVFVEEIRRKWSRENRDERSRRRSVGRKVEMQSTSPRRERGRSIWVEMKSTASPCRGERKSGTTSRAGSPVEVWPSGDNDGESDSESVSDLVV